MRFVDLQFFVGKKVVKIDESPTTTILHFEDGSILKASIDNCGEGMGGVIHYQAICT